MSSAESETDESSTDDSDSGRFDFDFNEFIDSLTERVTSLQGRFEEDGSRDQFEQGGFDGPAVLASDESVVMEAVEKMKKPRQYQKARDVGIKDEEKVEKISVEMNIGTSGEVTLDEFVRIVKEFDNLLAEVRKPIVDEIKRRQGGAEKNPMVDDDEDIMTYIFEESAGEYGDVTIFGGGKSIVFSLCEKHGFTDDERELIRKAHEVAADRNGVERHSLVEDVLVAPKFKHEDL